MADVKIPLKWDNTAYQITPNGLEISKGETTGPSCPGTIYHTPWPQTVADFDRMPLGLFGCVFDEMVQELVEKWKKTT